MKISRFASLLISFALPLLLAGCASTRSISVSESSPIPATYEQGIAVLKSQKTNGVVVRLLTSEFNNEVNGLPAIYVAVSNGTQKPFDFSSTNITATSDGSSVKVYSFEELQKRIKREAAMLAFALAMSAAGQSVAAAAPQTTYTSGNAYAYGTGGYARASYSGYTTSYNPAATAAAQAQINANLANQMNMVASARNAQLNDLNSFLRRNTVAPEGFAGGVVKLHAPHIRRDRSLKLQVNVGGEVHEFVFEIK